MQTETHKAIATLRIETSAIRLIRYAVKSFNPEAHPPRYWLEFKTRGGEWQRDVENFVNRKTATVAFQRACLEFLQTYKT